MNVRIKLNVALVALLLGACTGGDDDGPPPPVPDDIFAPLGEIVPYASAAQADTFEAGLDVAKRRFTVEEGLGPDFNVTFCASCHEKPVVGGSSPRYRNFLLVGQQLSDGSFSATKKNGVQTQYEPGGTVRATDDDNTNVTATRNGIPFFGVGLLAELPDSAILRYADPNDENGDGISGRPNYDRGFVGRFGRKSQTVSIEGFIRGPLFNHLGITTNPLSEAKKAELPVPSQAVAPGTSALRARDYGTTARGQAAAPDEPTEDMDGVPDPEMSEQELFDLVSFSMLLAAPKPDAPTEASTRGKDEFARQGCTGCHVPALVGPRGSIPLYSDLLLHDMGPDLADGFVMKEASGSEFRTQPLWGVVATGPYLHDGRADTIDEAIRLHGGEGQAARDAYVAATDAQRADLFAFLESLGGKDQFTEGLLPPAAPVPPVGTVGGPAVDLGADEARFVEGRRLFDHDFGLGAGLGPMFNGDSCRACHFEPTIGGAGPLGVNVVRHGFVDGETFRAPDNGTMAHRLGTSATARPPADVTADVFELRQTPSIFGLGAIVKIPDATIMALEDPTDMDGDGVFGIAHRKDDGRVGKLGWKANVPDLVDFAQDAMGAELGVTVPDDGTSPFGAYADGDTIDDPEITRAQLEDLVFFMESLAPPPRRSTDAAAEARGETSFADIGCATCHIPSLDDADGNPVNLYSDLLLHVVATAGTRGIADGPAGMTHFRTPPLWGIGDTAPYMHDGRASTLEAAIAAHDGEATASRMGYEALAGDARADLLMFLNSL